MSDTALLALVFVAAACVFAWVFAATFFAFGKWARVKIDEVKIGLGPAIFTRVLGGTKLVINLLPITSFATPRGMNPYAEPEPPEPPLVLWADAPAGRRILALLLAPRVLPSLIGVLLAGPRSFASGLVSGLPDLFSAFYAPLPLLDRAAERLHAEGFVALVGVALSKLIAWHLIQLPLDLWNVVTKSRKTAAKVHALAQLAIMGVGVAWLVGFGRWALR